MTPFWAALVTSQCGPPAGHLLSGLHSKLAAITHSVNKLEEHNPMCIIALRCEVIINRSTFFLVTRESRCSKLFFTLGRDNTTCQGSLGPKRPACGGRLLNFSGVHLPTCGLQCIYNPYSIYSTSMRLSVWRTSRNTGRWPNRSRHLQNNSFGRDS